MEQGSTIIKFKKDKTDFYKALNEELKPVFSKEMKLKADKLLHIKFVFYTLLFIGLYCLIFSNFTASNPIFLGVNYMLFGLSGILLAFNASHDAVHDTLFKSKKWNAIAHYIIFNLQGVNATLWKQRHISSHHIFPNVDGCDADIDDNPFIRLSESHQYKSIHKYQHIYATFLYCLYTLHWIFIKDFVYLRKERVANMTNLSYFKSFILETILLKIVYLTYTIALPTLFTDYSFTTIFGVFLLMHFFISIFFVLTLIISHLTIETAFPKVDKNGLLPFNYYEHQLSVSMDYHPKSKLANWIFGGFNSHSAHHLFPHIKHTLYMQITPFIQQKAKAYNLPYHELSILEAIKSHYCFLKKLGKVQD